MEIRLRYVLPGLIALGAIVNLALTQPRWQLFGFAEVTIRANRVADYSPEIANLSFSPIDPDIIEDAGRHLENSSDDEANPNIATRVPSEATATPQVTSEGNPTSTLPQNPTLPAPTLSLPTLPIPTLPLPTLPLPTDIVPTLPVPTVEIPDLPVPTIQLPILPLPTLPFSLP